MFNKVLETMHRNTVALITALGRVISRVIAEMEIEAMIRRIIPRYLRQGGWRECIPG